MPKEREPEPKVVLSPLERKVIRALLEGKTISKVVASTKRPNEEEVYGLIVDLQNKGVLQQEQREDGSLVWQLNSERVMADIDQVSSTVYGHHTYDLHERMEFVKKMATELGELTGMPVHPTYDIELPPKESKK